MASRIMDLRYFSDTGLLWAINRHLLHPKGYALAFVLEDDGQISGWQMLGDGTEVWRFPEESDDGGFERFNEFMASLQKPATKDKR